jgi:phenylacetate-coenzyme A ligase PaaK-like adenylate-forming protein
MSRLEIPESAISGMTWPALPGGPAARMFALARQLDESQWWASAALEKNQMRRLEVLDPSMKEDCERHWGAPVVNSYSAKEIGAIALQCPEHGRMHIQSESLLVEILDETGRACGPGEIDRMVISDLHNFAMPLILYEIGDYAEMGEPCPCGRGLPVLQRVLGRTRNRVRLPSDAYIWPRFGTNRASRIVFRRGLARSVPVKRTGVCMSVGKRWRDLPD